MLAGELLKHYYGITLSTKSKSWPLSHTSLFFCICAFCFLCFSSWYIQIENTYLLNTLQLLNLLLFDTQQLLYLLLFDTLQLLDVLQFDTQQLLYLLLFDTLQLLDVLQFDALQLLNVLQFNTLQLLYLLLFDTLQLLDVFQFNTLQLLNLLQFNTLQLLNRLPLDIMQLLKLLKFTIPMQFLDTDLPIGVFATFPLSYEREKFLYFWSFRKFPSTIIGLFLGAFGAGPTHPPPPPLRGASDCLKTNQLTLMATYDN